MIRFFIVAAFLIGFASVFINGRGVVSIVDYQAEQWKLGESNSLTSTDPSILADLVEDPANAKKLTRLRVHGNAWGYAASLDKCVKLKSVCLGFTKDTRFFLKDLPPHVTELFLDGTDFGHSPTGGMSRGQDLTEVIGAQVQSIANCESLKEIFIGPWDGRFTAPACELLPQLKSLEKLKIEWGSEDDITALRAALPNCKVTLVTEH